MSTKKECAKQTEQKYVKFHVLVDVCEYEDMELCSTRIVILLV